MNIINSHSTFMDYIKKKNYSSLLKQAIVYWQGEFLSLENLISHPKPQELLLWTKYWSLSPNLE